ncbi:MAG: glycosyltransferase family 2 protein [Planctomycetes bacterium]|nr:glycosyltransferase family 2 protein [Planctomycetota bacterium]
MSESALTPDLSLVIPVYNEEENLEPLTAGIVEALAPLGRSYEVLFVDDGSTDRSLPVLKTLAERHPGRVRILKFKKNCGQSAAFDAGFRAARGGVVVTMDADLQNDPRDIPKLLEQIGPYDAVCGWREKRRDNVIRRLSSRIGNGVRNWLSHETIRDTGCSLKAFKRECFVRLKMWKGMHRFLPTLVKMDGFRVTEIPVNHHPRKFGVSKYGVWNRAFRAFADLLAVAWMQRRRLDYEIEETL